LTEAIFENVQLLPPVDDVRGRSARGTAEKWNPRGGGFLRVFRFISVDGFSKLLFFKKREALAAILKRLDETRWSQQPEMIRRLLEAGLFPVLVPLLTAAHGYALTHSFRIPL
jgi:hypothetical protein